MVSNFGYGYTKSSLQSGRLGEIYGSVILDSLLSAFLDNVSKPGQSKDLILSGSILNETWDTCLINAIFRSKERPKEISTPNDCAKQLLLIANVP